MQFELTDEQNALRDAARRFARDEIAPAALYLASDASTFATGSVMVVDGGYTLW